uniref:Predicted protein n=1 Tax=Hordeum vulgare subsp. vulgare TaxID=112509 RepID=F2D5L8_HORVV|nr:predicted protein [Hordeum vulgare subsp. vulgare]
MSGRVARSQPRTWSKLRFSMTTTITILTGQWISRFLRHHFSRGPWWPPPSRQCAETIRASRRRPTRRRRSPAAAMAPERLTTAPEHAQSITRTICDVVKEHDPLTISDIWDHVKDIGLSGLTSKRQMKIMLRWMREKQKLRLICDHDGPHKQFLYTTWFTNPKNAPQRPNRELNREQPKP